MGFTMICYGAVDAISSLSLGKIVQYTGRPVMLFVGTALTVALYALLIVWKPDRNIQYLFYLAAGFLGLADAIYLTQVNGSY